MLNFYTWFPTGKVVFVAPTKPLVAQQIEACHESCGIPGRDAIELTGTVTKNLRRRAWEEKRVFYMTPQTFFNDLKDGTCNAEDIVLVVIDEAHRATGSYAYVTIVHYLMARNPHHRILALSATPGKNSETVQSIVDGLHISRIEIRDENSMDLQKYIFKKHTDIQIVAMNDGINDIKASLVAVMNPLLKTVQTAGCCNNADPETMNAYRATAEIASAMQTKDKNKMRVLHPLKSLAVLARAMGYLVECSVAMCERVLRDFYESGGKQHQSTWNKNTEFQATLNQIAKYRLEGAGLGSTRFPPHPKMEKLNEILVEHFDVPDASETRVMVFTNFRESVDEIVAHLNANESGIIKAHRFIGQAGGKGGDKGMSQKEQLDAIKRFKAGEFNVLVATSIGEEGLDIGEIDLIACYDAQKAPVRMLQRVGRTGRKREGKVVVLLAEVREERNWDKAKESYRDVQQAIIDGSSIELFDDAARMIPEGVQPQCLEKRLDIEPYDREVHGDLTGKRLRTKTESSASAKKRKRNSDVNRNVPEGALLGFVTAANLTVRKKGSKKKTSAPRADGLDSDDDAIEAGIFGSPDRTRDLDEDDDDTPARKRATKAKTPATKAKAKPRKSTAVAEDPTEPATLSQPALISPKVKRTKSAPSTVAKRSLSTSAKTAEADPDGVGDTLVLTSSDAPLKSSPSFRLLPPQPKPFPLSRKPPAPPSSPVDFSLNTSARFTSEPKDEVPSTSGAKEDFSLLLSDSDIEILDPTPPRIPSPEPMAGEFTHRSSPLPNHKGKGTTITFTSPASPKLDPPTDSPDRSFPPRRVGVSTRMAILDSSPLGSPSGSQNGEGLGEPSTPPRRRIRRGRPPSPDAEEAEPRPDVRKKGKKVKRSILEKNRFLETEAQLSGSEGSDDSFDPAGLENDYDREFVRTSPLTQAPAGYNQRQYYVQSLMTQVPGGSGPRFASGPARYDAYLALGNKRREGVSSSPVRISQSQYVNDSFVVDDDEEIEYEGKSSDID
ncbi:fanconi anemia group M protein [Rhizoctonia solani AG-1 IB]|uniref:ATP-dependent DNA helicase n=1 Tax=Thanatephorus cucumeris (strain AG1-IB / isolate 7/3/14) TaxID=1108050 RepID=A0A0B7FKW0_THACB|nr:fanconi anemia group M protein [Rhizoctonia solani AG-1 IB]